MLCSEVDFLATRRIESFISGITWATSFYDALQLLHEPESHGYGDVLQGLSPEVIQEITPKLVQKTIRL